MYDCVACSCRSEIDRVFLTRKSFAYKEFRSRRDIIETKSIRKDKQEYENLDQNIKCVLSLLRPTEPATVTSGDTRKEQRRIGLVIEAKESDDEWAEDLFRGDA